MRGKVILLLLLLFFISPVARSQSQQIDHFTEVSPYQTCFYYGISKHNLGWGLNFRLANGTGHNRYVLYDLDILSMKHPKELKVINTTFDDPRPYVYGKINRNMLIRLGAGVKHQLAQRTSKNAIGIDLNYTLGPVLSILKPVYLDVVYQDSVTSEAIIRQEKFNPDEPPSQMAIYGYSPFRYGMNELSVKAGMYVKVSASFEWGGYNDDHKAIETGLAFDIFPRRLPLLAYTQNKYVFVTAFISFSLGNKS